MRCLDERTQLSLSQKTAEADFCGKSQLACQCLNFTRQRVLTHNIDLKVAARLRKPRERP